MRAKFGVAPERIPDYLSLVGDSADGYPGLSGVGPRGAASLITRYGRIENFPKRVLGENRNLALLFKKLATLQTDAALFSSVDELEWRGPTRAFATFCKKFGAPGLVALADKARRTRQDTKAARGSRKRLVVT